MIAFGLFHETEQNFLDFFVCCNIATLSFFFPLAGHSLHLGILFFAENEIELHSLNAFSRMTSQPCSLLHTGPGHLLEASFKEQIQWWNSHPILAVITAALINALFLTQC